MWPSAPRNAAEVAATEAALAAKGVTAVGRLVDVSDGAALAAFVDAVAAAMGGLDIVVANVSALAIPNDEAGWKAGFETDMMGTVRLVNAALPHLQKSSAAAIVTISSVSGREIDFAAGPYGAFKAAIIHYTQGLAYHLAGQKIRANSVSPGNTYFPGGVWEKIQHGNPDLYNMALGLNPTGRMGTPQENGQCGRLPGQPGGQLHHRHQPGGGRRAHQGRPALIPRGTGRSAPCNR